MLRKLRFAGLLLDRSAGSSCCGPCLRKSSPLRPATLIVPALANLAAASAAWWFLLGLPEECRPPIVPKRWYRPEAGSAGNRLLSNQTRQRVGSGVRKACLT